MEDEVEIVLIDTFVVPEEGKAEFLAASRKIQTFIRTLPGFVEGFAFEKTGGDGRYNFLTTAVWKDEAAYENAKQAVAAELKRSGANPQALREKYKIESTRSTYKRSPY